jgi:hypothetical protein
MTVCSDTSDQYWPAAVPDGDGGVLISWLDFRDNGSIYAARMTPNGLRLWESNGVKVSCNPVDTPFDLVCDGDGGALVAWTDDTDDIPAAQRIDRNGRLRWGEEGVRITRNIGYTQHLELVPCGEGAFIAVFSVINDDYDVCAQRLDGYGVWGLAAPVMLSAEDVPGDQGGSVLITWARSYRDEYLYSEISHYSVWRKLEVAEPASYLQNSAGTVEMSDITQDFQGPAVRIERSLYGITAWEWVKNVNALMLPEYSFAAPTYCDSIQGDTGEHQFQVAAHREDPLVFWVSEPIGGYSVDNLAPDSLLGLSGMQQETPAGVRLEWEPVSAEDISHYNIYRNDGSDFVPSSSNRIGSTDSEYAFVNGWNPDDEAFSRVAAVDLHGNIGPSTLLSPGDVELVATMLQSYDAELKDERVVISWTLSEKDEDMVFVIFRAEAEADTYYPLEDTQLEVEGMCYSVVDQNIVPGETYSYRVKVNDSAGSRILFESAPLAVPEKKLSLSQNYPNPFNPATEISYYLPEKCRVVLEIFDISGRRVVKLVDRVQDRGEKSVRWEGRTGAGEKVSSGVYFCRLRAGKKVFSMKMILLK